MVTFLFEMINPMPRRAAFGHGERSNLHNMGGNTRKERIRKTGLANC